MSAGRGGAAGSAGTGEGSVRDGSTDRGSGGGSELERRYRRLLRCFPAAHREVYGAEMLGLLLEVARPGQRRPGVRVAVNLAACGLGVRGRRALIAEPWQDALAVLSLILPVVAVAMATLNMAAMARDVTAHNSSYVHPFSLSYATSVLGGQAVALILWVAVLLLALGGGRRAAGAIAAFLLAVDLAVLTASLADQTGGVPFYLNLGAPGPVLVSLLVCSLWCSPGPRRGLVILGRRRATRMAAGLTAVLGWSAVLTLVSPGTNLPGAVWSVENVAVIVAAAGVTLIRGPVGVRVTALVAVTLSPGLVYLFSASLTASLAGEVLCLLLAVLMWPVAFVSWRHRASRPAAS